ERQQEEEWKEKNRDQKEKKFVPLSLIHDGDTRWNSTHDMISRLLETRTPLNLAIIKRCPDLMLSAPTCEDLKEVNEILQPFKRVTQKLSGERYPTLSLVAPLIF